MMGLVRAGVARRDGEWGRGGGPTRPVVASRSRPGLGRNPALRRRVAGVICVVFAAAAVVYVKSSGAPTTATARLIYQTRR